MRPRQPQLVVAFHTTAEAIATERLCTRSGLDGRLVPVPRSITSDCGMAWSAPPELRDALERLLHENGVETAGFYQLAI